MLDPTSARSPREENAIKLLNDLMSHLGPEDQGKFEAAVNLLVQDATARDADNHIEVIEFSLAVRLWQQQHLEALREGLLAVGSDKVVTPLKALMAFASSAFPRLALQVHTVDGSEAEQLDALRRAALEVLEVYHQGETYVEEALTAARQNKPGHEAMHEAVGALTKILTNEADAPQSEAPSEPQG